MILFVDDEPSFVDAYVEALTDNGYKVFVASDINIALDVFIKRQSEIQLVILDIMMDIPQKVPEVFKFENANGGTRTGLELLRIMNQIPNGELVPKIILTNVASESFFKEFNNSSLVLGCYKKRELRLNNLVNIVSSILRNSKG